MLPESLYSMFRRPKGRPPYFRTFTETTSVANVFISSTFTIPDDTDAIILGWFGYAVADASQTVSSLQFKFNFPGNKYTVVWEKRPGAGTYLSPDNPLTAGLIHVPRGSKFVLTAQFSAAVQPNGTDHFLATMLVPPMQV